MLSSVAFAEFQLLFDRMVEKKTLEKSYLFLNFIHFSSHILKNELPKEHFFLLWQESLPMQYYEIMRDMFDFL